MERSLSGILALSAGTLLLSSPRHALAQEKSVQTAKEPVAAPASGGVSNSARDSASADNLQGQKPLADFVKLRHDFGEIVRGQKQSYAFEFVNSGTGVLQIRSIHSACGCVNTKVEPKDVFAPGEKGKISFEFDSSYFSGPVVRTITVDTNQVRNATLTLTFTAQIREEIRAVPALLGVGEILPEYNKAWLLTLPTSARATGNDADIIPVTAEKAGVPSAVLKKMRAVDDVKPLFVTSSHPSLVAEILPPAGEVKDHQLKISFKGGLPIGPLREKVTVWNSSRHLKELIIPVIGEVVGHVKLSAKYIEFGIVTRSDQARRVLTLVSDRKDFTVESVTAELRRTDALEGVSIADILKYSTVKSDSGTQVNFELRYPEVLTKALQPINTSGVFIVRTNDTDYKELRVPFFGVLRQGDVQ
ncbi:MAG: hypothetical protein RIR26_2607 [Pseudomonadota bacterium]